LIGGEGFDSGERFLVFCASRVAAPFDNLADSGRVENSLVQVTIPVVSAKPITNR
jgi:hypothetical protein